MFDFQYLHGFRNHFQSEAKTGAIPQGQYSPQNPPLGLYPEQVTGSAFTSTRQENFKLWLYRLRPSVMHGEFKKVTHRFMNGPSWGQIPTPPNQMRWTPMDYPSERRHFLEGLFCMAGNGQVGQNGSTIYLYACNESMKKSFFYSSDGEFLIVPQEGRLEIFTELGKLLVSPEEVVVIPRGLKFQVFLPDGKARGYVCENFGAAFQLPDLGPIGSNGLADPRHFQVPVAAFEDVEGEFKLYNKFNGHLWLAEINHSPLDVVGWTGNYVPYKYDLRLFNTINTVSFDHPDPSIFTVLTSPSGRPGYANVDFVIFPPRWMVAENTFRPPYFHRNYMNEFMGLIKGVYDAKSEGFVPGGASLHNRMTAHGPDYETFEKASLVELKPHKIENTLAFMFESNAIFEVSRDAMESTHLDSTYRQCWQGFKKNFKS